MEMKEIYRQTEELLSSKSESNPNTWFSLSCLMRLPISVPPFDLQVFEPFDFYIISCMKSKYQTRLFYLAGIKEFRILSILLSMSKYGSSPSPAIDYRGHFEKSRKFLLQSRKNMLQYYQQAK